MNAEQLIQDSFLDFLNKYPVLKSENIPMSVLRLCYFSGYNAAVKTVDKMMEENIKLSYEQLTKT